MNLNQFDLTEFQIDLDIIVGIFLLSLAVSGNFMTEALSCNVRKILSENIYAKNLIILLTIYFSLGLVSDKKVFPIYHIRNTFIIWLLFLIFNKMNIFFTSLTFLLLFTTLRCKNWIDYYKANDEEKNEEKINKLERISKYLILSIIISIIIGFLLYFITQYTDHYKKFKFFTFIFGKVLCDNT